MQSGRLRKRITIESYTVAQGETGQETKTWSTYMSAWAAIEPMRGREFMEAKQLQADVDTRIRMRGQPDKTVKPSMRVKFGTRTYLISSVINVNEIGEELQLICKEQIDG